MLSLTVSSEQTRGRYRAHRADIRTVVAKILRYRGANGKGAIKKVFVVPDNSCLALGKISRPGTKCSEVSPSSRWSENERRLHAQGDSESI